MNNQIVKIGEKGRIIGGKYKDWYIFISDETKNGGGYLILLFTDSDRMTSRKGVDYWAEDLPTLEEMFKEAHWAIHWMDSDRTGPE